MYKSLFPENTSYFGWKVNIFYHLKYKGKTWSLILLIKFHVEVIFVGIIMDANNIFWNLNEASKDGLFPFVSGGCNKAWQVIVSFPHSNIAFRVLMINRYMSSSSSESLSNDVYSTAVDCNSCFW